MSDPATPTGGLEHDAWLREALRHAPDASAAPPLSLRDAILAEARAAAKTGSRTAPPPSFADRFAELWSWLARPPVAAGFASVMAATLVGLMWWDRPLDEMAPPPPAPVAASRAPATEAARPTPAPAAQTSLADQAPAATRSAPPTATPVAPAEALRPAQSARPATVERASATDRTERRGIVAAPQAQPPAAVAGPLEKAKAATDALREERKDADSRTSNASPAMPAAATTATAATAPGAAAAPTTPAAPKVQPPPLPFPERDARGSDAQASAPARSEPAALAKKTEKSDREGRPQAEVAQNRLTAAAPAATGAAPAGRLEPSTDASTDGGGAAGRFSAAPRPAPLARQRAAEATSTTARPMAQLLAALSNESARWSRPTSAGETVAADAATQAWLARVEAAAASQWQPVSERLSRLDGTSVSSTDANTMLLYREGRAAAMLRIDDAGVYFETRPGTAWFAPLPPEVVARLRATLPATTR